MKQLKFPFFLLLLTLLAACSIQPRRYRSGFHIEFRKSPRENQAHATGQPEEAQQPVLGDSSVAAQFNFPTSPEPNSDAGEGGSVAPTPVVAEPKKRWERQVHKWAQKQFEPVLKEHPEFAEKMALEPERDCSLDKSTGRDDIPLAGRIFAWMGFGLIALSFSLFIYSFFYKPQGGSWGDLALLVSIIIYSWLALAFALIAQIIFWASGSVTPWYQWPAITLGVLLTLAFVIGKIKG